jgi:hypothetical protein
MFHKATNEIILRVTLCYICIHLFKQSTVGATFVMSPVPTVSTKESLIHSPLSSFATLESGSVEKGQFLIWKFHLSVLQKTALEDVTLSVPKDFGGSG